MFDFKKTTIIKQELCPMCGHELTLGDTLYEDEDRNETVCNNCIEEYKEDVISEEGEDGRLLK